MAVLAAVAAVPLYFTVFTVRVFEPEKSALLRLLGGAVVALLAFDTAAADRAAAGSAGSTQSGLQQMHGTLGRRVVRHPLGIALLGLWCAEAASTALSVAPLTSLLGSYERAGGLATSSALLALALAAAGLTARGTTGAALLARSIGIGCFPAGLYGLLQRAGLDPLPWTGDVVYRPTGPSGSSPLFAGYLAVALPFAVASAAGVIASARAGARSAAETGAVRAGPGAPGPAGAKPGRLRFSCTGPSIAWLIVAATGFAGLLVSGSRGPLLALAGGTAIATATLAARHRKRAVAAVVIAASLASVGGVVALNRSDGVPAALSGWTLVERSGFALDPNKSTARVRRLLWRASAEAIADAPLRIPVGRGPETMGSAWAPYYPPVLAYDEPRGWVPDRAHNLVLDRLFEAGLLGLMATVAVFGTALHTAFGLLGARSARWIAWCGAGAVVGAALAHALGAPEAVPAAGGLGAAAGLLAQMVTAALGPIPVSIPSPWRCASPGAARHASSPSTAGMAWDQALFPIACIAALAAHWIDLQLSFASISSACLAAVIAGGLLGAAIRGSPRAGLEPGTLPAAGTAIASLIGFTLVHGFARPGMTAGGPPTAIGLVALPTLIAAVALGAKARGAAVALGLVAAYASAHLLVLGLGSRSASHAVVGGVGTSILYAVAVLACLSARVSARGLDSSDQAPSTSTAPARARDDLAPAFLVMAAAAVLTSPIWLFPSAADGLVKEGRLVWEAPVRQLREAGETGRALAMLTRARERYVAAVRVVPWQARYRLDAAFAAQVEADLLDEQLARLMATSGEAAAGNEYSPAHPGDTVAGLAHLARRRDRAFEEALGHIAAARRLAGPAPGPTIARARALRVWGEMTRQAERRSTRLAAARTSYAAAISLAPGWPELRDEAARTALLAGDHVAAEHLARAARLLDEHYLPALVTLARAASAEGNDAAAVGHWQALFTDKRAADDVASMIEHGRALLRLERWADAAARLREAAVRAPDDSGAHADLALALGKSGDRAAALGAARRAAKLAPLDGAIAALVSELEGASPGVTPTATR